MGYATDNAKSKQKLTTSGVEVHSSLKQEVLYPELCFVIARAEILHACVSYLKCCLRADLAAGE